jgi:hypothetical protein
VPAAASSCNTPCTGNASETCGGGNRLSLYWSGSPGPGINPGAGGWVFSGCYAYVNSQSRLRH